MSKNINIQEIPAVIQEILKRRGVEGKENIKRFLFPQLKDLPVPSAMKGMEQAVDLIFSYFTKEKQIIIWGDYDVDGTTGTALLVNFFKKLGRVVDWHIPNRLEEGYGLNAAWFTEQNHLIDSEDFLLVTVDCGISDADVIDQIQKMGGTVIVTDHHKIPEKSLPDCVILNPSQKDCGFNSDCLAGVGVAFYLASGLRKRFISLHDNKYRAEEINLKQFLAFVALGTVADVVHLSSTNRILVRGGIEAIQYSHFPGITALLNGCEIKNEKIGSEDIGFLLGPLINAAGRIGDSKIVVQLLTSEIATESSLLVNKLIRLNSKRKSICATDFTETQKGISANQVEEERCIVVAGTIHQGIAGIVASRLVDVFRVPTLVFSRKKSPKGESMLVGSARSVDGVSVIEALNNSSKLLEKYGGHDMAAGATLLEKNFIEFSVAFKSAIAELMSGKPATAVTKNVFACSVEDIMRKEYLSFFELLEPFGPGNQAPVFIDENTKIVDTKCVGRGSEHLQLAIRGKYANYKGIGFGLGNRRVEVQQNPDRSLRYTLTKNRYRGRTNWQIRVIDI
jgi:single-stranded-DNA-specific exonuclease